MLWRKPSCRCGAGTPEAHGKHVDTIDWASKPVVRWLTCDEVIAIRARSAFARLPWHRRAWAVLTFSAPEGW